MNSEKKVVVIGTPTCVQCKNLVREIENYYEHVDMTYYEVSTAPEEIIVSMKQSGVKSFPAMQLNGNWEVTSPQKFLTMLN